MTLLSCRKTSSMNLIHNVLLSRRTELKTNVIIYLIPCIFHYLKVGLSPLNKVVFICFNKSPLKRMKNAFYFTLKAFFLLSIFKFLSWLCGCVEKRPGQQIITTHILPNISRAKVIRQWNLIKSIEYKMKSIFLEKSCTKCGGKTIFHTFLLKIIIEHIWGSTIWNVIRFVFIVCRGLPKYIKIKVLTTCFYLL